MRSQKLLEGEVIEPAIDDSEIDRLRDELRRVSGERDALRSESIRLRQRVNQIDAPAAQLRNILEPLHQAIRAIFGEIEVIDPKVITPSQAAEISAVTGGDQDRLSPVWDSWKRKLGPSAAKIITALQEHGELNTTQLSIVAQMDTRTVNTAIWKMNKASLINKNGGKFSLKQL